MLPHLFWFFFFILQSYNEVLLQNRMWSQEESSWRGEMSIRARQLTITSSKIVTRLLVAKPLESDIHANHIEVLVLLSIMV